MEAEQAAYENGIEEAIKHLETGAGGTAGALKALVETRKQIDWLRQVRKIAQEEIKKVFDS